MDTICPDCGFSLSPKIGTLIVVCVLCGSEFELKKIFSGLDEFLWKKGMNDYVFKKNEFSDKALEDGK